MGKIANKIDIDDNYLRAFLVSTFEVFNGAKTGATIPHLDKEAMYQLKIPLPPLSEQKRIVAILDEAFANLAIAKKNAEKNLQNARAIFDSKLNEVFSKKGDGWVEKKLGDLFDITSSKRVFESEWRRTGVPFYRAREIVKLAKNGFVDNELFISEEMFDTYSKKYGIPTPGDIMVTGVGTLGICYVVKDGDRFYFKDGNIIWLKKKSETNSRFVGFAFQSDYLRIQIDDSVGATVGTYTIIKAKSTRIPIPPLPEQLRIVAQLDALSAETRHLCSIYERKLAALEELKKSLLHQAFEGGL